MNSHSFPNYLLIYRVIFFIKIISQYDSRTSIKQTGTILLFLKFHNLLKRLIYFDFDRLHKLCLFHHTHYQQIFCIFKKNFLTSPYLYGKES